MDSEENPIIEEIREIREQMLAEYGGDMSAYLADLRRRRTEKMASAGRVIVTRSPRPAEPPPQQRRAG